MNSAVLEKFLKKVEVKTSDECWEFQGARDKDNYGKVRFMGRVERSNRVSYILHNDLHSLDRDVVVRHTCDNPPCCNPGHLITGTQQDNVDDMMARGRHKGYNILTREEVEECKRLHIRKGWKIGTLAKMFGVEASTISMAVSGKNWKTKIVGVKIKCLT